jgi:hypothetical protein
LISGIDRPGTGVFLSLCTVGPFNIFLLMKIYDAFPSDHRFLAG